MKATHVTGICLGIYAAYLPIAIFLHRDFVPSPRPVGMAEQILQVQPNGDGYWARRSYVFSERTISDPRRIAVLEDMVPLQNVDVYLHTGQYVIRFKTSDGSNPNRNGRTYWTVQQPEGLKLDNFGPP